MSILEYIGKLLFCLTDLVCLSFLYCLNSVMEIKLAYIVCSRIDPNAYKSIIPMPLLICLMCHDVIHNFRDLKLVLVLF